MIGYLVNVCLERKRIIEHLELCYLLRTLVYEWKITLWSNLFIFLQLLFPCLVLKLFFRKTIYFIFLFLKVNFFPITTWTEVW